MKRSTFCWLLAPLLVLAAFADITKMNGVSVTTSTKINGAVRAKANGIAITAGGTPQSYAFVASWTIDPSNAAGSTRALTVSGITTGSLLVAWIKNETAQTLVSVADDGGSTWVVKTSGNHAGNDLHGCFAYTLSAAASITTITATFSSAAANWKGVKVAEFSHAVAAAYDTEQVATGTTAGGAPNHFVIGTGTLTSAASPGLVLGGFSEFSNAVMSLPRVAANVATGLPATTVTGKPWLWYYITSGSVSGAVDCDLADSSAREWVVNGIAFK